MSADAQAFRVDLAGLVDLLARHLYSGPRVYLRELLQNGVDAITARRATDPGAPGQIRIRSADDGSLTVTDTGIGLDLREAEELLATIGRSSKRDVTLGLGRDEFLGQFGIGLLSAFMVAGRVELTSRSARGGRAVRWRGYDDGSYDLAEIDDDVPVGSTVRLVARRDAEHWLEVETVVELARSYGELLPLDIAVEVPLERGAGGAGSPHAWRRVTRPELPWRSEHPTPEARTAALREYCERTFGFTPLAHLDLDVPLAGLTGVAFVLPEPVAAGTGTHRVYLKRMLLGERVEGVLPDWAFFVRCVLDADGLRPTASREALYVDEVLLATRDVLGERVRTWAADLARRGDAVGGRFLRTHHLAVRAMALGDDTMLDVVADALPYETTDGPRTLAQVHADHGDVVYTSTVEDYRKVAPVLRAQGSAVVNAGYVYDAELLERIARRRPAWGVRELTGSDVAEALEPLEPVAELELADFLADANRVLAAHECDAVLRRFAPEEVAATLLTDREGDHQRRLADSADSAPGVWADVLATFAAPAPPQRLVLNARNAVVAELLASPPGAVREAALEALYVQATLLAGRPLRGETAQTMTSSLAALLRAALAAPAGPGSSNDAPETEGPA